MAVSFQCMTKFTTNEKKRKKKKKGHTKFISYREMKLQFCIPVQYTGKVYKIFT